MKLNSITRSKFVKTARFAAAGLAAAALLSACGGGSVDVIYDGSTPPPAAQHVTDAQAQRAAATSLFGGPASLFAPSGALLDSVSALLDVDPATGTNLYTTQTLNLSSVCNAPGGSLTLQTNDAGNDRRFTAGDTAVMSFSNCALSADGLNLTLNGNLTMTVQPSTRGTDVVSTFFFSPQNLSGSLQGVAASYSGLAGVEYTFPGGNLSAIPNVAYVSDRIALAFAGSRSDVLTHMRWTVISGGTTATPLTTFYPSHTLTLNEFGYTDTFITTTISPAQYQGGSVRAFTTGQMRHRHTVDDVYNTITATNVSRIDVDYFGDGVTDLVINDKASALVNSFH
jgi:hypothetical protein